MSTGIILLNFGEPEDPTPEAVVAYLERIFRTNMSLEGNLPPERVRARVRQLAEERAPGLIEELESIGGSPLNRQALAQADVLEAELARRGHDVRCYVAYQFAEPLIADVVRRAREDGVTRVIGFPVYPLAGPSTTVAALDDLRRTVDEARWTSSCARSAAGTGTRRSRRCGRTRRVVPRTRPASTCATRASGSSSPCTARR